MVQERHMHKVVQGCSRALLVAWLPLLLLDPSASSAQQGQASSRRAMINASDHPMLEDYRWRSIGPVGQGGRVDDIAVSESNPRVFYVGFATGGLWKTTNNGTTFEPIFDTYTTHSVGDLALAPSNEEIVYVGTGEPNNRQSSSFGDGMYKSTDGGRTFTHMGLRETQSIARVVVHPRDPNIVWVAANGHLFGPNPERGVFKSTDGGSSWTKTLFVNDHTGATDLVIDPSNPDVLWAATYQRQRTSWGFASGGGGSGIWKSTDGGQTWSRLAGSGLPNGTMGRIALDVARSNPRVLYAQIEVATDREQPTATPPGQGRGGQGGGGGGGGGRGGQDLPPDPQSSGVWRSDDGGATWRFLTNHNPRPMYFSQIRVDPTNENVVYTAGLPVFKSTDGGRTFEELDGFGHVDQHAIWIDPRDGDHVMIGNDGSVDVSWDQGETWESLRTWAVGQPYHVSVDMRRPYTVCTGLQDNGSWCGPSSVRTGSILPQDWYRVGGGDGFFSAVDPTDPFILYTESQNGNVSRVDLRTGEGRSIRPRGRGQGGRGGGGGGGQGAPSNIAPEPPAGTQIRWNWSTPFMLSPHNPRVIYVGGNRLFKSYDRGDTWTMSPDLSRQVDREGLSIMGLAGNMPSCGRSPAVRGRPCILSRNDGVSNYGTIVTISESPRVPGILWVGTDDGAVQVSRDGGATWTDVTANLRVPEHYYVSRVEASHFDPATAYVSLDGHRSDDLRPYVYVTRDYGRTWTSIASNLPAHGNVNVVKQDPRNPSLLYAGTEFGFFVSLDEGASWQRFMNDLPVVRIDDVIVHPRDNDLVLATHGRSIWIMDDITALQQLTPEVLAQDATLFAPREAVLWKNDRRLARSVTGHKNFEGESAPDGAAIAYYLKDGTGGDVAITITELATGRVFRTLSGPGEAGLNRIQWNLRGDPPPREEGGFGGGGQQQGPMADAGLYRISLSVGGREHIQTLAVVDDLWMVEH
jgi:photosystem II stability/assembly factor-like uncharacterized protein